MLRSNIFFWPNFDHYLYCTHGLFLKTINFVYLYVVCVLSVVFLPYADSVQPDRPIPYEAHQPEEEHLPTRDKGPSHCAYVVCGSNFLICYKSTNFATCQAIALCVYFLATFGSS